MDICICMYVLTYGILIYVGPYLYLFVVLIIFTYSFMTTEFLPYIILFKYYYGSSTLPAVCNLYNQITFRIHLKSFILDHVMTDLSPQEASCFPMGCMVTSKHETILMRITSGDPVTRVSPKPCGSGKTLTRHGLELSAEMPISITSSHLTSSLPPCSHGEYADYNPPK